MKHPVVFINCENACLNKINPSPDLSSICDYLHVCPCVTEQNVESQESPRESLFFFLHAYLIDAR